MCLMGDFVFIANHPIYNKLFLFWILSIYVRDWSFCSGQSSLQSYPIENVQTKNVIIFGIRIDSIFPYQQKQSLKADSPLQHHTLNCTAPSIPYSIEFTPNRGDFQISIHTNCTITQKKPIKSGEKKMVNPKWNAKWIGLDWIELNRIGLDCKKMWRMDFFLFRFGGAFAAQV